MDPLLEDYTYYPIENEIPTIPENNSGGNTTGVSAPLSNIWPVIDNEDKVVISAGWPIYLARWDIVIWQFLNSMQYCLLCLNKLFFHFFSSKVVDHVRHLVSNLIKDVIESERHGGEIKV